MSDDLELTVPEIKRILTAINFSLVKLSADFIEAKTHGPSHRARRYKYQINKYQIIKEKICKLIN